MRRFLFKLEPLLSLRQQVEEQARDALARELAVHAQLEAELRASATLLGEAAAATALDAGAAVEARDLALRQAYVERREREREDAAARVSQQEVRVESQRLHLEECARERSVVERLREKAHTRHRHEEAHRQSVLLDEIATTAHARKTRTAEA